MDELMHAVPIHQTPTGKDYILLDEIPQPWRTQFERALRGSAVPKIDGSGLCAWLTDWRQWAAGQWYQRPISFDDQN